MKMKQLILIAATVLSVGAQAQTVNDGIKMYQYERYESAKKALAPLMNNDPKANYYYGLCILQLGNADAAKSIFSKFPENYANISGIARVAFVQKNVTEGTTIATALAAKAKKREWEQLKYAADAITYTSGGDVNLAIEWYTKALAFHDSADIRIALGDAYQKLQSGGGKAMDNYESVVAKEPSNSLAYSRVGKLWYGSKNYKLALENWDKAQKADPENPLPYGDLADAYSYTGKYELAKQNLEKYLQLSDQTTDDIMRYAEILYLCKDYSGAAAKAQELISKGVSKASLFGLLAFSQMELKQFSDALKNVRIFIGNHGDKKIYPDDYRNIARIMLGNNLPDSANYYFNAALSADESPNKADAYRQNADALRGAKEYSIAAQWYKKLSAEFPDQMRATDYFYWGYCLYYGSRDFGAAGTVFEQMETKFPDQPSAPYWRGRAAAAIDSEAKAGTAVPHYEKWLSIKSEGYERKPGDLKQAYEYLIIYNYNKGDKEATKKYMDALEAVDPNDALLKQLKDAGSKPAAKPAGAKKK